MLRVENRGFNEEEAEAINEAVNAEFMTGKDNLSHEYSARSRGQFKSLLYRSSNEKMQFLARTWYS